MLDGFSHVMVFATDVGRAAKWYGEVLGFRPYFVHPGGYASLGHRELGIRLDVHHAEPGSAEVGHGTVVYFKTRDIEAAIASLRQKGVRTGEPRREGESPRFAEFWDSEGNRLGLEEAQFGR